jgi:hypothetical protein
MNFEDNLKEKPSMKLQLLNNKKEKYQEEIFDVFVEEVKKIARIFHGNEQVDSVEISFNEDDKGNVFFSDIDGIKIKGKNNGENVSLPITDLPSTDQDYIFNVTNILDFFVKNYPVDSDDKVIITQLGVECNLKQLTKNKNKLKT